MNIEVAKTAGFCFGVDRAVQMVYDLLEAGESICTLGPIIHNPQLVQELAGRGVEAIGEPREALSGRRKIVIRSHGVARSVYEEIMALGLEYVDATCPFVAKIHRIVAEDYGRDALVLIAGDAAHPEVQAIVGHCRSPFQVVGSAAELEKFVENAPNIAQKQLVLVAQTTLNVKEWSNIVKTLKKVCTKPKIFDTICSATMHRQQEAESLAARADRMIVVGGRHSSNTGKLYDICSRHCPTVWVETAAELDSGDFAGVEFLGITAGASTPACIIKEVQKTMSDILTDDLSFEEMLNLSFKSTYTGEKVTGVVTSIAPNEVAVDIGTKHAGYIPLSELSDDPAAKTEDLVKKGDELELIVLRVNDVEGTVMLSKKRLDAIAGFEKVVEACDNGEVLEGVVTEVVRGGVLVLTGGVKVFIPASQATRSRNDNLEDLLKQTVKFKILEYNRQRRRAVGSIRAVLKDERKALEAKFWEDVEVGKVYHGTVKSLTDYGAFIDLGGVDGMVHISELSWSKIKHPSQVVNVGDQVEVYVKDIDPEKKKISLGYKKSEDNPWEILKKNYQVDDAVEVKIVSLTQFGAFAQIIPGVDGLIHISQISNERINKPSDVLKVGDVVKVKITEIDYDKKRISLSIKALLNDEADEAADAE
ncbi:MAG: bifunctional 4-hydroxy-3-methylbut-2-enyl diphosphate reductase/30S ribosomal protein S1 [Clostridiales bacterium]|nr:bifunctional 4-hydroxy-3-methylbut-2-enyl diphosphate reductase/30S ribosomal protein S1 [Clostridiales bacterium]